jgi:hypothetical protein
MNKTLSVFLMLTTFGLMGCQTIRDSDLLAPSGGRQYSKYAPPELIAQPVEDPDIIALLTDGKDSGAKDDNAPKFRTQFDNALRLAAGKTKAQRNAMQDRLFMASNKLCERYKVIIKKKQSNANFLMGSSAVFLSAAGAIAPSIAAAQTLSALSGVTSGIRAEYNQDYFADVMAHIVTKGIASQRQKIRSAIDPWRQKEPDDYTVEAAIADAFIYHGACTLTSGLEAADQAISKDNPNVGINTILALPVIDAASGAKRTVSGANN